MRSDYNGGAQSSVKNYAGGSTGLQKMDSLRNLRFNPGYDEGVKMMQVKSMKKLGGPDDNFINLPEGSRGMKRE